MATVKPKLRVGDYVELTLRGHVSDHDWGFDFAMHLDGGNADELQLRADEFKVAEVRLLKTVIRTEDRVRLRGNKAVTGQVLGVDNDECWVRWDQGRVSEIRPHAELELLP